MHGDVVLDTYEDVKEALYHPDLSRGIDPRSYEQGNPRAGVLSVLHGDAHKLRRRIENPLFRRSGLEEYERALFPAILDEVCGSQARGAVDLFQLGGELSVVLAARRAGVDHDGSRAQLGELWRDVLVLAQAAAIFDVVGDGDAVQARARAVLAQLDERYVTPSRRRREALLDAEARGEPVAVPHDLLTVALRRLRDGTADFDHGLLVREAGLYLHGGSHTSTQTLCNVLSLLLDVDGGEPDRALLARVAADVGVAQRCVHETLRLRPTTPRIKRVAVRDLTVAGRDVAGGAIVVLDIVAANRDPALFGAAPDRLDPDRTTREDVPLWGLSFGAGPHICIGRSVAGGFPLHGAPDDGDGEGAAHDEAHLYGLVALMVQAVAKRGVRLDPDDPPVIDRRTDRGTRWSRFPVLFPDTPATAAASRAVAEAGAGRA